MNKSKNKTTVLRSFKLKDLNTATMLGTNQQTLTRNFNVSTSSQYSLSPNRNSTDNYAQSANGLFYLKVGEDVVYERNEINGGWMVTLLRPIKITRDISWSSTWGGTLTLYIEKDWNMNLTFSTSDGWRTNNQWIYGRMSIETDVMDPDTSMYFYSFENDIKNNKTSITRYTESKDGGIKRGKYYSIKNLNGANKDINIFINHNPYSSKINTLFVRDLNGFIRFDGEFAGYYNGLKQINYNGPNDMFIKVFNTIGVRMPYLNIMQSVASNNDFYDINIPNIYAQSNNLLLDISKCLNVEQQTNGAFKITLQRPIRIINNVSTNTTNYQRNERVITTIGSPNNLLWNITTYLQRDRMWPLKYPAGDLTILINTTNENDNEYSTSNANAYINNSIYKKYSYGSELFDNYINPPDENGGIYSDTPSFITNANTNKNVITVRSLDNIIRINASFADYGKVSRFDNSYYYQQGDININANITLVCRESKFQTPSSYYPYKEVDESGDVFYVPVPINDSNNTTYNKVINSKVATFDNMIEVTSLNNMFFSYFNNPPPNGICYYTYIKHSDQIIKADRHSNYYGFDVGGGTFVHLFDVKPTKYENEYTVEIIRPFNFIYDVSIPGRWGGKFILRVDEYFRTDFAFEFIDGWLFKNQTVCGTWAFRYPSDKFNYSLIFQPNSDELLGTYNMFKISENGVYITSDYFEKNVIAKPPISNGFNKVTNKSKKMLNRKKTMTATKNSKGIIEINVLDLFGEIIGVYSSYHQPDLKVELQHQKIIITVKGLYFTKDSTVDDPIKYQDGERVEIPNVVNTDISKYFYSATHNVSYEITPTTNYYFNASLSGNILTIKDKRAGGCKITATGKYLNDDLISFGRLNWGSRITDDDIPKFTDNVLHLWLTPKDKHSYKKPDIIIDRKPNSIIDGVPTPELLDGPYELGDVYAELADDLYNNNSIMKVLKQILNSSSEFLNNSNISYLYITGNNVDNKQVSTEFIRIFTKQIIQKQGNERKFAFEPSYEHEAKIRNVLASFGGIYPTQPDNTNGKYGWEESGFEYNSYWQNNNFYKTLPIRLYIEKIAVTPRQTYINNGYNEEFKYITPYSINIRKDYSNQDLTGQNLIDQDLMGAIFTNANLTYTNFQGAKLAGANLSGANLSNTILSNANLSSANLSDAKNIKTAILIGATFTSANLSGLDFSGTNLSNTNFSSANLSNTNFSNAIFTNTNLSNANLSGANLSGTNIKTANITGATLTGANLSGLDLSEQNFSSANLSNTNFSNAILTNTNLSNANLTNANLSGTNIKTANITGATLTGANLSGLDISGRDFSGTNLSNTNFSNANLSNTNLSNANLSGANLSGTNITGATFIGANLSGLDFSERDLSERNFSGANLSNTNFSNANLSNANLSNANLSGANLSGTNIKTANITGATLTGANLSGLDLSGRDFSGANLSNTNFSNAILTNTNLSNANLSGANLTNTTLTGINLSNTNLSGRDFSKTNFSGANLTGADFSNTNFTGANLSRTNLTNTNLTNANLIGINLTGATFIGTIFYTIDFNSIILSNELTVTGLNSDVGQQFIGPDKIDKISIGTLYDNVHTITINDTTYGNSGGGNQTNELQLTETNYINEVAYSFSSLGICDYLEFKTTNGDTIKAGNMLLTFGQSIRRLKNIKLVKINGKFSSAYFTNLTFTFTKKDYSNQDLTGQDLTDQDLTGAIFTNANLTNANFQGVKLAGANLSGANLSGANLSNANLSGANLSDAKNIKTAILIGATFTGANLSGLDLSGANLSNTNLSNANFSNANLSDANLSGAILSNANLSDANLSGANLSNANLTNANLTNANLSNANLTNTNLSNANLTNANLSNAILTNTNLSNANLTNANLSNAILTNTNLSNANLTNANLSGTNIKTANITGATLTGANLSGLDLSERNFSSVNLSNTNLSNAILTNTNLSNTNLSNANLSGTNIKTANITGATLTGANLSGLDLSGRDFSGANLSNANLSNAILTNTNLSNANLTNANLSGANLSGANLSNITFSNATLIGINLSGQDFSGRNFSGANLSNANLSNINFSNAFLTGTILTSANLAGANLTGADFSNTNFTGANLSRTNLTNARFLYAEITGANLTGAIFIGTIFFTPIDFNSIILSNELTVTGINSDVGQQFTGPDKIDKISIGALYDNVNTITINDTTYGNSGGGNQTNELQLTATNYINEIAYSFSSLRICDYLEFKTTNGDTIKVGFSLGQSIRRLKNIKLVKINGKFSSAYFTNLTFTFTKL